MTVTLVDGHLTSKWATKTYLGSIKAGVRDARKHAQKVLDDLREATEEAE